MFSVIVSVQPPAFKPDVFAYDDAIGETGDQVGGSKAQGQSDQGLVDLTSRALVYNEGTRRVPLV